MKHEQQKFTWYLPRAIVLLTLYLIPGIRQTVAPVLQFLFSAWMLTIQYYDYPFDNRKVPSEEIRTALCTRKIANMQFGALTNLFTMIPLFNLFIVPVTVCGTTAMWVDRYHDEHAMWRQQSTGYFVNRLCGAGVAYIAPCSILHAIISLLYMDMLNPYFRIFSERACYLLHPNFIQLRTDHE